MSDQAQASAPAEATAMTPDPSGLTDEEKLLIQCKNPKEAINYKLKVKKIVTDSLKWFQRGTDPDLGDTELNIVYPHMVHDLKKLVSSVFNLVAKANCKEILKTVTNPDGKCICNPKIMDDDDDDGNGNEQGNVQVQEEAGIPATLDWVDVIQSLDITLDEHQMDKLCMLLKCHSGMLERQVMCSRMLAELGRTLHPVTFCLILQKVI